MTSGTNSSGAPAHDATGHIHVVSVGALVAVWVVLMALTGVTVWVANVDLGSAAVPVALAIATVKGTLVALIFMHLWWDSRANKVVLIASMLFLAVFVAFVVKDSLLYQPDVDWTQVAPPAG